MCCGLLGKKKTTLSFGVLLGDGVLGFWGFGVLGFWGFGVLGNGFVQVMWMLKVSARQDSSDIWLSQIPDPSGGLWPCAELTLLSNRRFCAYWRVNQTKKTRYCGSFGFGAPARTRTWNPRLRRPVLYPVELRARNESLSNRYQLWRIGVYFTRFLLADHE